MTDIIMLPEDASLSPDENREIYLEDIPLTAKTYNALNMAGIETLGETAKLFRFGDPEKIKGIGRKEKKEIETILGKYFKDVHPDREKDIDETASEYDRRKELFEDWLYENRMDDDFPNLVYVIESLEEYVRRFYILKKPIFNVYSPYEMEDLLEILKDEADAEDYPENLYGEALLFVSCFIDYLYEEDAGVHYKRGKRI